MKKYLAIGLMSGTSMDGIDAVLMETDGREYIVERDYASLLYPIEFQQLLKCAEGTVRSEQGDMGAAHQSYAQYAKDRGLDDSWTLAKIIAHSTQLHINLVQELLEKAGCAHGDIDVVGYHGQTLFHNPAAGVTVQVGDAQKMTAALQIPVVNDFRSNDIKHGGQGAPLVPIFHRALLTQENFDFPAVVVNCGGIANLTWVNADDNKMLGFDTGPGNVLIDAFVREMTEGKETMDTDGHYGLAGQVSEAGLMLLEEAFADYYERKPPKSADSGDFVLPKTFAKAIAAPKSLLQDGCATLAKHTVESIFYAVEDYCGDPNIPWVIVGGGWNNPALTKALSECLVENEVSKKVIHTTKQLKWNNATMEAQAMAYFAVRHLEQLPFTLPGTTGVDQPRTGGTLHQP